MNDPTRVRDLFELPDQARKGDLVLKLSEGIEHARETASPYVVTKSLVDSFDRARRLVGSALRDGRSQAAYLHGSFGSGKSHVMALLTLLLDGWEKAWRIPEFHALREADDFIGRKKLLQLHSTWSGKTASRQPSSGATSSTCGRSTPRPRCPGSSPSSSSSPKRCGCSMSSARRSSSA